MRLIDADAAKKAVEDVAEFAASLGDCWDVVSFLDDQPTVELLRWIPVTERLPENNDDVLVWYKDGFICIGCYENTPWLNAWMESSECITLDPTHWMPLPEPPKEDET